MEIPPTSDKIYPCAIVGGGLGGLCLSIQLARQGLEVVLFEKNSYPQHRVCGEYISMESWGFLTDLGVPLNDLDLPLITQLGISSENGYMLNTSLPLGGFGMSRHSLDDYLCRLARYHGVLVHENCKVLDVQPEAGSGSLLSTSKGTFRASIVCGSFGKYTPVFAKQQASTTVVRPNFIGVKYHIQTQLAADRIELHIFQDGYCGIVKVDKERYCLCYLTKATNLQNSGNDIKAMEATVLYKNPFLKAYFKASTFLFDQPMVVSNVNFHPRGTHLHDMFLIGDAAGTITPLCGNGMSMAMRASKLLANLLLLHFKGKCTKEELISQYARAWASSFHRRIRAGQYIQSLFGKKTSTHLALKTLHYFPALTRKLVGLTHGEVF